MPTVSQKYEVELIKKEPAAKDSSSFYFQRPQQFDFLPGQFMRLSLTIPEPDERGNSRFFSIASSPTEKDFLMITTRADHSAYKKTLFSLASGTKVSLTAPYGVFILKPEETTPHVFLAGGIGITPFRSMIRYAADMKINIPITLFTSFRSFEDIVFQKELAGIAKEYSWFKLVETITQPEASKSPWLGNVGRIDTDLIKKHVSVFSTSLFYIAGPPAMVDSMEDLLKSLGINELQIRKEKFTGY